MRPIHARYPFLDAARESVDAADLDLLDVIQDPDSPVRRRAIERIDEAITDGRVDDPSRDPYVEVISYPLARVLVSLVNEPALTTRFAEAEAERAYDLFADEVRDTVELRSRRGDRLTLRALLAEFDLEERVREVPSGYRVAVPAYLALTTELRGGQWRLVTRALDDGEVPVTDTELFLLLREAVRQRVAEGLPLDVPETAATHLAPAVERIESTLSDVIIPTDFDQVDPAAFPPCMVALLERVDDGRQLPPHSRFALVSFLAAGGMSLAEISETVAAWDDPAGVEDQFERLHGDSRASAYPPPSCAVMAAYGDCVNKDQLCERIDHPLQYYDRRLADPAVADDVTPR